MQTTLTGSFIDNSDEIISHLDNFNALFNTTKRHLYKDIIKFYKLNNTNKLTNNKINELKSSYQIIPELTLDIIILFLMIYWVILILS